MVKNLVIERDSFILLLPKCAEVVVPSSALSSVLFSNETFEMNLLK